MIKVTTKYGNEWINPDFILVISRNDTGSIIDMVGGRRYFTEESPDEIINILP